VELPSSCGASNSGAGPAALVCRKATTVAAAARGVPSGKDSLELELENASLLGPACWCVVMTTAASSELDSPELESEIDNLLRGSSAWVTPRPMPLQPPDFSS
jgi:hypothetical protein